MLQSLLQGIGLTENEVSIYLLLLPVNQASVSNIARQTSLDRTGVRYVCRSLVGKGLVREEKEGNTFIYRAEQPEKILQILKERKNKLEQQEFEIEKMMGVLHSMRNPFLNCPGVQYFEGVSGIKEVYEDILKEGKDVYCWTNFVRKKSIIGHEFVENYSKRRQERGMKVFSIEPEKNVSQEEKDLWEKRNCFINLVPDLPLSEGEVRIYGEKIAFLTFNSRKPLAFVFQSRDLSLMFKAIFTAFLSLIPKQ